MGKAVRHKGNGSSKDVPEAPADGAASEPCGAESGAKSDGSGAEAEAKGALGKLERAGLGEGQYFLEFREYVDRLKTTGGQDRTFLDTLKEWRRLHDQAADLDGVGSGDAKSGEDASKKIALGHNVPRPVREVVGFGVPRQDRQGRFDF